jgi:hypothetical protein
VPRYVPDPDKLADAADLIEELGAELASRYAEAEDELIRQVAKRAYRDMQLQRVLATAILTAEQQKTLSARIDQNRAYAELAAYRAQTIRELQFLAVEVADKLRRANLAQTLIDIAAAEGEAAAAAMLRMARRLPGGGTLTPTASQAVASLTLDMSSRLEAMNWRITRYPQDAYQRVISFTASNTLLGTTTGVQGQAQAVQRFLSQGITGFVDEAERNWRIGSYAEMAGRTAVRRAYEDAAIWRMQQSGINLVTISGGIDACKYCAPWIGKILSTNGQTGTVELPHATRDEMVTVEIYGTLDQAKMAGWGHPNCRDRVVAYLPGLTVAQDPVEYSPEREAARTKQREIEREIRAAKREAATAGDDISRKRAERDVKELQAGLRQHLAATGRTRANYREQLHFADGHGRSYAPPPAPKKPAPRTGIDIQVAKGTKLGDEIRSTRSAIAQVHTIPNGLNYLPVRTLSPSASEFGAYRYNTKTGLPVDLGIRGNGPTVKLTTAHEVGHYLDHQLLGTPTKFGTETLASPAVSAWLDTVRATPQVLRLQELLPDSPAALQEHIEYLLSPVELWGRSYGQYIGTRSGDRDILAGVDHWLKNPNEWSSNRQWGKTDFEPVANAMDAIFKELGLLK